MFSILHLTNVNIITIAQTETKIQNKPEKEYTEEVFNIMSSLNTNTRDYDTVEDTVKLKLPLANFVQISQSD